MANQGSIGKVLGEPISSLFLKFRMYYPDRLVDYLLPHKMVPGVGVLCDVSADRIIRQLCGTIVALKDCYGAHTTRLNEIKDFSEK